MPAMTSTEKNDYQAARDTACPQDGCKAKPGEWCGNPANQFVRLSWQRKSAAERLETLAVGVARLAVEVARLAGIASGTTKPNRPNKSWNAST
jgi:hypothetical protein